MPAGLRWFAEYQPFTPVIDTLRALLGAPGDAVDLGTSASLAVGWCLSVTAVGYLWSRRLCDARSDR
ncbi:multidrug ABC transporter permease [Pseudonocardia sp. EC080610-09]|uniref:multidrug ABC transporter permease n=1 Tax=unclassified Pseudonocardia TaxID=2619320 RepID=UPI0006CB6962|nr:MULTISPECIES: multidrug ABC transporter permease [unclassified Pseudonocardia]ALE72441.1 multidrug ABC transporter permease [Pseudonocardia sp. EC080625-04]ALL75741.1 multidrug ABC transporter permease [Pseudonocardia sp. EC080610-09]ALL82768.1 multidrug ABC transporter permease [Pseudonocardia sp. EC080619-01]